MVKIKNIQKLEEISRKIRIEIIKMLSKAGSGHPAGSLGITDIMTALYFNIMKHDPKKPEMKNRDRLILSNGHICPARYATMAYARYFPKKELMNLRKLGSKLQGHPSYTYMKSLESSSGPLGLNLSLAAGQAVSLRADKINSTVFCITSDGEHDEGNTWEAIMFAGKYKLNNLINIIDRNNIQLSGKTEDIMPLESLKEKYLTFNWNAIEINGNNIKKIITAITEAKKSSKPTAIIAKIIPGKGVSFMENKSEWHGKAPNKEETKKALKELSKK
jgi:transketolase